MESLCYTRRYLLFIKQCSISSICSLLIIFYFINNMVQKNVTRKFMRISLGGFLHNKKQKHNQLFAPVLPHSQQLALHNKQPYYL